MIWARDWSGAGYSGWNRQHQVGYGAFVNDWQMRQGNGHGDGWSVNQRYITLNDSRVVTIDNWHVVKNRYGNGAGPRAIVGTGNGFNPKMTQITGGID